MKKFSVRIWIKNMWTNIDPLVSRDLPTWKLRNNSIIMYMITYALNVGNYSTNKLNKCKSSIYLHYCTVD